MKLALIPVLLAATAAAAPAPSTLPADAGAAAHAVTAGTIAGATRVLASDLLEGRSPPAAPGGAGSSAFPSWASTPTCRRRGASTPPARPWS
jgi:hypothetical protein